MFASFKFSTDKYKLQKMTVEHTALYYILYTRTYIYMFASIDRSTFNPHTNIQKMTVVQCTYSCIEMGLWRPQSEIHCLLLNGRPNEQRHLREEFWEVKSQNMIHEVGNGVPWVVSGFFSAYWDVIKQAEKSKKSQRNPKKFTDHRSKHLTTKCWYLGNRAPSKRQETNSE